MGPRLEILGSFRAMGAGGASVDFGQAGAHLVAFLALEGGAASRGKLARTFWPSKGLERARANLRAVLWRLPDQAHAIIDSVDNQIELAANIVSDVAELEGGLDSQEHRLAHYARPLLPGWYDEWVLDHRDRLAIDQLRSFECIGQSALARNEYALAIECGLHAIGIEPLEELSHQIVLRGHLGQENVSEAFRHFEYLEALLRSELGVAPSDTTAELLRAYRPPA